MNGRVSAPVTLTFLQWCTLCKEFGRTLILCAGCRVGICSMSKVSHAGCLRWNPAIERSDFVFYCPFCSADRNLPCVVRVLGFCGTGVPLTQLRSWS